MDPTLPVIGFGLVGGVVIALVLVKFQHRLHAPRALDAVERPADGIQHDPINVSSIRVAGVGGLGLLVLATGIALNVPRIGLTLAVSAALGTAMATLLILRRRRTGPMPSSGQQ